MISPFVEVAPSLIEQGYSVVPIGIAGPNAWNTQGKEPGKLELNRRGEPEWQRLKGWHVFCSRQAHPLTLARWSEWPDAGIGLACGFGGVIAIDIDDDALVDPLIAVLPPVVVAKRGRKGVTVFYRSLKPLPSKNYRTSDKRGLLDFLSDGKQTVLPPTAHPAAGHYHWTTTRTLLDTPLSELPIITTADVGAIEEVLRAHGWEAPAPTVTRESTNQRPARATGGVPSDSDFDSAVTAARAQWLPLLGLHKLHRISGGWRAVASFRPSGSGKATNRRGESLSIRDSGEIYDHGSGRGFNNATLVSECLQLSTAQAFVWLREVIGWTEMAASDEAALEPSYPDRRITLDEAERTLRGLTGDGLDEAIIAGIITRNQSALREPLIKPRPKVSVVRTETGTGKTRAASEGVTEQVRRGRHVVHCVPRHDLADELAASYRALENSVEVYRGYERPDPLFPDHAMCRNLPAYKAARDLGVGIRSAICERRLETGETVRCPFSSQCGMERQREAKPDVWIVPAPLLFSKRPDFIPEPDALVIDERFHDNAVGERVTLDLSALIGAPIEGCTAHEYDVLTRCRHQFLAAIRENGDGWLSRDALIGNGLTAEDAHEVGWLEQRRVRPQVLRPDMPASEIRSVIKKHAELNRLARAAGTTWHEIATFLEEWKLDYIVGDRSRSGRLVINGNEITASPLRTMHDSWRVPTLVLDATAPPAHLLARALGEIEIPGSDPIVIEHADIAVRWPNHVRVRQIVGAPVSKNKLGLLKTARPRNIRDVLRFIKLRAALAAPAKIGLIIYKKALEQIGDQLPPNVVSIHFGALSGSNVMEKVAGLIVIGRPAAERSDIEKTASVFAGHPIGGPAERFFERAPGGIRLSTGAAFETPTDRHPDAIAEALRWQITEAELLQAIGRLRPHRRAEPCWLDIVCDVPLPISIDEVLGWADVAPGASADMVAAGVVLTNSRDAMVAFDLSKRGAEQAGNCPHFSIGFLKRDLGAISRVRRFTYRKAGQRGPESSGCYLPGVLPGGERTLRAWLEAKLGPLASLQVERAKAKDSARTAAMFVRIGRDTTARLERPMAAYSQAMQAIDEFFEGLEG